MGDRAAIGHGAWRGILSGRRSLLRAARLVLAAGLSWLWVLAACESDEGGPSGSDRARLEALITASAPRLVLEVDAIDGLAADPQVLHDLVGVLGNLVDKPSGIEVIADGSLGSLSASRAWTWGQIQALSAVHRSLPESADTAVVHVLLLDGRYAEGGSGGTVLGLSDDHRIVVLFVDEIERSCVAAAASLGRGDAFEARLCRQTQLTIWSHELGHVLGLVDVGVPMVTDHHDDAHPGHDVDPACVMHAVYNSSTAIPEIQGKLMHDDDPGVHFCGACLADLEAFAMQAASDATP